MLLLPSIRIAATVLAAMLECSLAAAADNELSLNPPSAKALMEGGVNISQNEALEEACYGETWEIKLVGSPKHGVPDVNLSIPRPNRWLVTTPENESLDKKLCHPEPILATHIYGAYYPRAGSTSRPLITIPGTSFAPRRMSLRSGRYLPFEESPVGQSVEFYRKQGLLVRDEFGFLSFRRAPPADRGGFYIYPDDYTTANGAPVVARCPSDECHVVYLIDDFLLLEYWFLLNDVPQDRWVTLDQQMRNAVRGWAEKEGEQ